MKAVDRIDLSNPCGHVTKDTPRETHRPTKGCEDCLKIGGRWVHLRRCAECGHVGCCDDSPNKHATAHWHESGHPVIQSFEPGEDWFWDYASGQIVRGTPLAPPTSHPESQSVPGPADRLPADLR